MDKEAMREENRRLARYAAVNIAAATPEIRKERFPWALFIAAMCAVAAVVYYGGRLIQ
jgi:uncharacterized membrane protein YdjX (TVP38/TMEM64 family)